MAVITIISASSSEVVFVGSVPDIIFRGKTTPAFSACFPTAVVFFVVMMGAQRGRKLNSQLFDNTRFCLGHDPPAVHMDRLSRYVLGCIAG